MKCGKCYMIWSRKEQPGRVIRNRTLSLFTYKRSFDVVFLMPLLFAFRSTILLEYIGRLILCIISSRGLSRTPSIASPKVPASSHEKNYSPHCHHALVVRYVHSIPPFLPRSLPASKCTTFSFWKPVTNPQRSTLHAGMIGSEDSEAFPNLSMV